MPGDYWTSYQSPLLPVNNSVTLNHVSASWIFTTHIRLLPTDSALSSHLSLFYICVISTDQIGVPSVKVRHWVRLGEWINTKALASYTENKGSNRESTVREVGQGNLDSEKGPGARAPLP